MARPSTSSTRASWSVDSPVLQAISAGHTSMAQNGAERIGARHGLGLLAGSPLKRLSSEPPLPKSRSTPVSAKALCRRTLSRNPPASTPILRADLARQLLQAGCADDVAAGLEGGEVARAG